MIIICDIVRRLDEHRTLNEPIVKALGLSGADSIAYLSSDSSSLSIARAYPNIRLALCAVGTSRFYRWGIANILLCKVLFRAIASRSTIVFCSLLPTHYVCVAIVSRIFKGRFRCLVFMHGELGYLLDPKGFGQKIGAYSLSFTFNIFSRSSVKFCAIGFPVMKRLQKAFPRLENSLVCFEHPPHNDESIPSLEIIDGNNKPLVGMFGVLTQDKNSEKIYDLEKKIDWKIPNANPLLTIGLASPEFLYKQTPNIKHVFEGVVGIDHVPWVKFSAVCRSLDWALFFYDPSGKYGLTPSGVLYDCIHWRIPIVALRNENFSIYFEKYGDLGVLCESVEEMALIVNKIFIGELAASSFRENFDRAIADMSLDRFEFNLVSTIQDLNH